MSILNPPELFEFYFIDCEQADTLLNSALKTYSQRAGGQLLAMINAFDLGFTF